MSKFSDYNSLILIFFNKFRRHCQEPLLLTVCLPDYCPELVCFGLPDFHRGSSIRPAHVTHNSLTGCHPFHIFILRE